VPDMLGSFPDEGQWDLLREHGLHELFSGQWVEIEDVDEVVRRLGGDPEAGVPCDFRTAMESYDLSTSSSELVMWIGGHAPGWSHILTLGGTLPPQGATGALSAEQRRVFDTFFIWATGHLHNLYSYDGECIGDVSPPYPGGSGEIEEFDVYSSGLELADGMKTAEVFDRILCMVGRITGRFIERDLFSSTRTLYRFPKSTWNF
ncbi:hypothetical protein JYK22_38760, partial [Nonomuraea sp. RK-328]|nr:hypothetical protein [Nonomuraea sp. RK-328]